MRAFDFKKSVMIKTIILISGILSFSSVYAQSDASNHDGGLMKQMTPTKYQPRVITDPDIQARLQKVVIAEEGHQNGGLMKQMTSIKYQPQVITDPDIQARLQKVVITEEGHQNGGLMKQMRGQLNSF